MAIESALLHSVNVLLHQSLMLANSAHCFVPCLYLFPLLKNNRMQCTFHICIIGGYVSYVDQIILTLSDFNLNFILGRTILIL